EPPAMSGHERAVGKNLPGAVSGHERALAEDLMASMRANVRCRAAEVLQGREGSGHAAVPRSSMAARNIGITPGLEKNRNQRSSEAHVDFAAPPMNDLAAFADREMSRSLAMRSRQATWTGMAMVAAIALVGA